MSRLRLAAALASVAVAGSFCLTACTSSTGGLTARGQNVLVPAAQHVREVAAAGSYAQLRAAISSFKSLVEREERAGQVSADRAALIEHAADRLLLDASPSPTPAPSETSVSPSPTPTTTSRSPSPSPTTTTPTPSPTPSSASPSPSVSISVGLGQPASTRSASPTRSPGSTGTPAR